MSLTTKKSGIFLNLAFKNNFNKNENFDNRCPNTDFFRKKLSMRSITFIVCHKIAVNRRMSLPVQVCYQKQLNMAFSLYQSTELVKRYGCLVGLFNVVYWPIVRIQCAFILFCYQK